MKILLNSRSLIKTLRPFDDIGFVPTMGGIHEGHISLIKKSIKYCNKTIVSIFVNPKQFNNKKDFRSYPSNIKKDLFLLKKIPKIDYLYIPKFKDIYKNKAKPKITIKKSDKILCAKFRKGHFEGVLDVMDRLTNLIKPNKIFMGKKDYQQLFLVKNYIEKKHKTKIIGCKTIRNKNKLALSSRNFLLKKADIKQLEIISKKFLSLKKNISNHKNISKFLRQSKKNIENLFKIKIEYLENRAIKNLKISNKRHKSKIFLSYYFKGIRLIDNF
tara:strand:+ start:1305 stop:2120 length:816 start_codon:yes stop_codon:yes gene_type:complete